MWSRLIGRVPILVGAALFTIHCTDTAGPERDLPHTLAQVEAGSGIQLDQQNGAFGQSGTMIVKGFNPTNPHVGDAIIATFFWFGAPGGLTGNIIDSVTDVLTTTPYTPVGNHYSLVEFVSDGTISMATYLATNVQNFPDAGTGDDQILAVKADLKVPVTDGGIAITAWIGVAGTMAQALGEHRSASGVASPLSSPTIADPGPITLNPGALAYGMTLANPPAGVDGPSGWTRLGTGGDLLMKNDGEYDARFTVSQSGGATDPQWSWFFNGPGTWLATVLALNPAPTTGNLTVTTNTSGQNVPTSDYTVTLDGTTTEAIPPTGAISFTGLQPGSHQVALSGLPANCELTSANPVSVTIVAGETATATFTVSCTAPPPPPPPPSPPDDFMTGGGKLGDGREFATFGLEARSSGGKLEWVQHCPNGASSTAACAQGGFTFHGTVTPGTYTQTARDPNCRTWSGTGTSKPTGATTFTVRQGCDGGEPGRGVDYIDVVIGAYQNMGYLTGGNIQLHGRKS
jgi:hypothetical protein